MGDQISTIILKVDLSCCHCNKKIRKVLCKLEGRWKIQTILYDEENGTVTISGPFCPHKLAKKLCSKACKIIKDIEIPDLCECDEPPPPPPPPEPKPEPPKPEPPPPPAPEPPKPEPPPPAPEPPKPEPPPPPPAPEPEPPKPEPAPPAPEPPKPDPVPPLPKPEPTPAPPPKPEPVIPVVYPPIWVPGAICCGPWYEGYHRPCACGCGPGVGGGGGGYRPCTCGCGRGCGWSAVDCPPPQTPAYGRPCNDGCRIEFFCEQDPACSVM